MLAQCEDGFEFDLAPRFANIRDLEEYDQEKYENPNILHFIGHSEFDNAGQAALLISDGANYLDWRPPDIGVFLGTIPTLRLAYLNACRTGEQGGKQIKKPLFRMAGFF